MAKEHKYIPGDPWMICDYCWFKKRRSVMRKDWLGFMACPQDWSPKPEQENPRRIYKNESAPIKDARPPEATPLFLDHEITADEL